MDARMTRARITRVMRAYHARVHARKGRPMTKSDRKRVLAALERWEKKYRDTVAPDAKGGVSDSFAAAVDWLRAEVKLAHEYLDPDDEQWADSSLMDAAVMVAGAAQELAAEIRGEAKNL